MICDFSFHYYFTFCNHIFHLLHTHTIKLNRLKCNSQVNGGNNFFFCSLKKTNRETMQRVKRMEWAPAQLPEFGESDGKKLYFLLFFSLMNTANTIIYFRFRKACVSLKMIYILSRNCPNVPCNICISLHILCPQVYKLPWSLLSKWIERLRNGKICCGARAHTHTRKRNWLGPGLGLSWIACTMRAHTVHVHFETF